MSLKNVIALPKNVQNKANDLFNAFFEDMAAFPSLNAFSQFPSIDVSENDNCIIIKAELPSMTEKDVKITIDRNRLFISGEKQSETQDHSASYHISEIRYGKFSRNITLPFDINANKTRASFSKGVLTINIEKPEEDKRTAQTIAITKSKE